MIRLLLLVSLLVQAPPPPDTPSELLRQLRILGTRAGILLDARVVVRTSAELQAALDTAVNGQTIALVPGVYNGNFFLRSRGLTSFVTITTNGWTAPAGAPVDGTGMAVLQSLTNEPDLRTDPGAAYWRVTGLAFGATRGGEDDMVRCGDSQDPVLANQPHHIEFIKNYGRGSEANGQRRGISLNCAHSKALFNRFTNVWKAGQDSQGIAAWSTSGPLEISDNHIEAASENILIGGTPPAGRLSELIPSDVLIERNTLTKNRAWALASGKSVKNLFELKFCRRCVARGNVMRGSWPDGQSGFGVLITVATNISGLPGCPACELVDILFEDNVVTDVAAGIQILGSAYSSLSGGLDRLTIRNNLFVITRAAMVGPPPLNKVGNGQFLTTEGGPNHITVESNTVISDGTAIYAANPGSTWWTGPAPIPGLPPLGVVIRRNVFYEGTYGILTPLGVNGRGLAWFPDPIIEENVFILNKASLSPRYPASNRIVPGAEVATVLDPLTHQVQAAFAGYGRAVVMRE